MEIDVKVPDLGLEEVEVIKILVKEGNFIKKGQEIITVEGQKSSMDISSEHSGKILEIKVKVGDYVTKNSIVLRLCQHVVNKKLSDTNQLFTKKLKKTCEYKTPINNTLNYYQYNDVNEKKNVHASPLIRRLSRNLNINLENIKGSGIKSRILREDITKYLLITEKEKLNNKININLKNNKLYNNFQTFGNIEEIKFNNIQKESSKNLSWNWSNIPHVTHFDKVDITNLESFRKKINNKNVITSKITLLIFLIKIVYKALKNFPIFNSSLSHDKSSIILKKYYNIGIAVNTSKGLLVPVIKNINKKNICKISEELINMSNNARLGQLTVDDMKGGCFTISNLGKMGGINFTPIINFPEVAILGVSQTRMEMIWKRNKFVPRLMLPLSMSYDHRVINGIDASYFITFIKDYLSDIRLLTI